MIILVASTQREYTAGNFRQGLRDGLCQRGKLKTVQLFRPVFFNVYIGIGAFLIMMTF